MTEQKKLLIFDFNGTLEGDKGLYEGVPELLKNLHESGQYHMVILSMSPKRSIEETLDEENLKIGNSVDLKSYFDAIYGVDEIIQANKGKADKTNPKVLEDIVENLALQGDVVDPKESVIVGDSFAEHLMAKRSGIHFLYAGWHDNFHDKPVKSGLMEIKPSPNSGHVGLTKQDISEAKSAHYVSEAQGIIEKTYKKPGSLSLLDLDLYR